MQVKSTTDSRRLSWIGGLLVLIALGVTLTLSWALYEHTVTLLTENLRQRLLSIGITQAANIDYRDIQALQTEEDWRKPEWTHLVSQLKSAKDSNKNIVFMYVFRKKSANPDQMEFVADAESINPYANTDIISTNDIDANGDGIIEPDGADALQWPGQDYPTPPEEAFLAYDGPLTNKDLYSDAFGEVLTGYAPIKNRSGVTVAILGTDIKAGEFFTVTRQTLYPFLFFIVFLVIAIVILASTLIKIWNKRIELFAELDRQKDELLSIVSHQLAAPVTAIKWYLESILDDGQNLKDEQRTDMKSMQSITEDLSDLVSMILDVSRIQLGKMRVDPQPLDLQVFFSEILGVIEPKAKEKPVNLVKSLPEKLPVALLDKRLTRMTVENLLTNAVKYTPKDGNVWFTVTIDAKNLLSITVKDTGVGIPKAEQGKIFGKQFRASNVRNAIDGNGFGLYVAKGAIEGQDGKIWFESEEGKGTTFSVEVPLKFPTQEAA